MVLIAIGVKLTSPGPVLFRQRRYGLNGEEINVYKFRSMTVCEDGAVGGAGDPERPANHAASGASCAAPRWTSCRSCSTCWKAR